VADSVHHRIHVYDSDEKEIATLTSPSDLHGALPQEGMEQEGNALQNHTRFLYPNSILFDGYFFIADTHNHRIVVLNPDGSLHQIVPAVQEPNAEMNYPIILSHYGNMLFVVNTDSNYAGGEIVGIDLAEEKHKKFQPPGEIDPQGILARAEEVLVSDRLSLQVLRFSADGKFLNRYGRESLASLFSRIRFKRQIFRGLRFGCFGGMGLILIGLIPIYLKERRERPRSDLASPTIQNSFFQKLLEPQRGFRWFLLMMVPGLGQAAAGRWFRGGIHFILCFLSLGTVLYFSNRHSFSPPILSIALMFWVGAAVDAIRLLEPTQSPRFFTMKGLGTLFGLPIIPALTAALAQFLYEQVVNIVPQLSFASQHSFYYMIDRFRLGYSGLDFFSALLPAEMLFGSACASATLFATLARLQGSKRRGIVPSILFGLALGTVSWSITGVTIISIPRGAFYMPLIEGFLIGLSVYLFFGKSATSILVIPAAISVAGFGNLLSLFVLKLGRDKLIGLTGSTDFFVRGITLAFLFYFILLGILFVMTLIKGGPSENDSSSSGTETDPLWRFFRLSGEFWKIGISLAVLGIGGFVSFFYLVKMDHVQVKYQNEFSMHLLHLDPTRFEDRLIGYEYAREELINMREQAFPFLFQAIDFREGALVEEIKGIIAERPRTVYVFNQLHRMESLRKERLERSRNYDLSSEESAVIEIIFNKSIDWDLRSAAAENLIRKRVLSFRSLLPLLQSTDPEDQKVAVTAINKIAFIARARLTTSSEILMEEGSRMLQEGTFVTSSLANLLQSTDPTVGHRAALALGWLGDPAVTPMLLQHFSGVHPFVQEAMIIALAELKDPTALKPLHDALRHGQTSYVRASAANALGNLKDFSSKKVLAEAFSDPDWLVRIYAAQALKEYQDRETVPSFVGLLSDKRSGVITTALYAIGDLGDATLKPTILKLADDPLEEVSGVARDVIYKFEHGEWPEYVD
jgi:HEAT repeat protein